MPALRPKHPCDKTCSERVAGCKITCERWAVYEAAYKAFDEQKSEERVKEFVVHEYRKELFGRHK